MKLKKKRPEMAHKKMAIVSNDLAFLDKISNNPNATVSLNFNETKKFPIK